MKALYILFFVFALISFSGCTAVQKGGESGEKKEPYIVYTAPANGQTKVLRTGNFFVEVYFSKEMDPVTKGFFIMAVKGKRVDGTLYWINGRTLQFRPDSVLEPNTIYECRLTDGYSMYREKLRERPYIWSFTTGP
ncbi:MAG: Ig-like domain-containing protein [Nitrospirota bacterium]